MSLRQQLHGFWLTMLVIFSPRGRRSFAEIFQQLTAECRWSTSSRDLFVLAGYSKVGKTTLATRNPLLQQCVHIENDRLITLVDQEFAWLCSDQRFFGPMFWPRRILIICLMIRVLRWLMRRQAPIVVDFCNQQRMMRAIWLWMAKQSGYHRTMIHLVCERQEHRRRLVAADIRRQAQQREPFFLLNYLHLQRRHSQPPQPHEADTFLTFRTDLFPPEHLRLSLTATRTSYATAVQTA